MLFTWNASVAFMAYRARIFPESATKRCSGCHCKNLCPEYYESGSGNCIWTSLPSRRIICFGSLRVSLWAQARKCGSLHEREEDPNNSGHIVFMQNCISTHVTKFSLNSFQAKPVERTSACVHFFADAPYRRSAFTTTTTTLCSIQNWYNIQLWHIVLLANNIRKHGRCCLIVFSGGKL